MVIIEGPDKAGKSTMANMLCMRFSSKYFHFENPKPGVNHCEDFKGQLGYQDFNTVFDRGCWSALAYDFKSPTDAGRVMTTVEMMDEAMKVASMKQALMVYCTATDDVLSHRLAQEGDANDYVVERELLFVKHVYDLIYDRYRLKPVGFAPRLLYVNTSKVHVSDFIDSHADLFRRHLVGPVV